MSESTLTRLPGLYLTLDLEEVFEEADTSYGYGTDRKITSRRGIAAVTDQMLTAPVMGALLRAIADEIDPGAIGRGR